jgi:hypothetical protein
MRDLAPRAHVKALQIGFYDERYDQYGAPKKEDQQLASYRVTVQIEYFELTGEQAQTLFIHLGNTIALREFLAVREKKGRQIELEAAEGND